MLEHEGGEVRVLGIDLGTTNSTVAEVRFAPGAQAPVARCLALEQETADGTHVGALVPSVVGVAGGYAAEREGLRRAAAEAAAILEAPSVRT